MKTIARVLGPITLAMLLAACSGGAEEPDPFGSANDLATRLATDLACPAYVDASKSHVFIAVQGKSRVIAEPNEQGIGEGVRAWASQYAADFGGNAESIQVVGEGRDSTSLFHVSLSNGAPKNVDALGYGMDLTLDREGRLLGVTARSTSLRGVDFNPKVSEPDAAEIGKKALVDETLVEGSEPDASPVPSPTTQLLLMTVPGDEEPRLAYRVDLGSRSAWIDARTGELLSTSTGTQGLQADGRGWKAYSKLPFPDAEKRRRIDYESTTSGVALSRPPEAATFWSKPKARIVASSLRNIEQRSYALVTEPIAASKTDNFDVGFRRAPQIARPRSPTGSRWTPSPRSHASKASSRTFFLRAPLAANEWFLGFPFSSTSRSKSSFMRIL